VVGADDVVVALGQLLAALVELLDDRRVLALVELVVVRVVGARGGLLARVRVVVLVEVRVDDDLVALAGVVVVGVVQRVVDVDVDLVGVDGVATAHLDRVGAHVGLVERVDEHPALVGQRDRGRGHRLDGELDRLADPALAPRAPALALGEVLEQLARQGARLAGHARAGAVDDVARLGRVRHRRGEQRGRQAAVLLARRRHEPAGVAPVRPAARVDEQPEQTLRLRPALHGVLLVQVLGVLGQPPDPVLRLVAAADALLASAWSMTFAASRRSSRAHPPTPRGPRRTPRRPRRGDLLDRAQAQLRVLVALDRRDEERALELARAVEVEHRPRPAPAARRDARAGELGPREAARPTRGARRRSATARARRPRPAARDRRTRADPALDAHAPPAPAAHGTDDDRAAAVDVAVEQRVQRDDGVVVLRAGVDEVDDDARLLARLAARDAADALLVDAPDAVGARCRQTVARGEFQPSASSCALMRTSTSPRS
jgi:hypothetical protein